MKKIPPPLGRRRIIGYLQLAPGLQETGRLPSTYYNGLDRREFMDMSREIDRGRQRQKEGL